MMNDPLWGDEATVKPDWDSLPTSRRECQSCFEWFETNERWVKRCPDCKTKNAPYRKKLIKEKNLPF